MNVDVKATSELLKTIPTQADMTGATGEGDPAAGTEVKVDETVQIAQNLNLDEVREQSEQNVPVDTLNPDGSAVVRGRSYKKVEAGAIDAEATANQPTTGITGGAL